MEFHHKLQQLRKQKGLTQSELAEALYVSRTAISKWESGRGYPNIDSLRAISKFFGTTVDELLSGDELLTLAEADAIQKQHQSRGLVFGLLDISVVMLLFLPLFGQKANDGIQSCSLILLSDSAPYLMTAYYAVVISCAVFGVLSVVLQNITNPLFLRWKSNISFILNALGAILFVISLQPYAALFMLMILAIKVFAFMKKK